ncbi:glycoside hydrolase family 3 protein [Pontibacter silvestris]|uniref:beta-N-acetylhexosaminidase n=1 Tax=Pontibacter silvestris TaxID=2305183 RepID=A0ABW4X1Y2_9BACT|nr:glycoside hydrolase family 3 N-terminal domain-containing protein [Pontibacter silvestris]MCC9135010.1 glycoside hydrolase family 3 C-terminal domain-containing protein [Pontibacter silvestris]
MAQWHSLYSILITLFGIGPTAKLRVHNLMVVLLPILLVSCEGSDAQQRSYKDNTDTLKQMIREPYARPTNIISALETSSPWVDSVFNTLTVDERIAQLIVIEAFSNKGPKYEADVMHLVKKYKVGGIIFFQGGPVRQAILTNQYQAASKVPLLISMDAETGVGMRLDSTIQYPYQQMLGAIADNGLIYRMGTEVASEFKRLGMHVNFAPVADINNNPDNPIISYRSFGENRLDVTAKSLAYMRGMQENGIMAVAKHFPGHGDTDIDSHYDLPVIPFSRHRLDSLELYPFQELIEYGVGGIMVAHMHIPQLDSTENLPSTLSKPIVTGLLKHQLKFKGLIFTDAMVMKGVTKFFSPGEAEARALMAGNDIVERLNSVPRAIKAVKAAIAKGELKQEEIDRRCKRVLAAKQWLGLDNYKPIDLQNLHQDLKTSRADSTNTALAEAALTLLRNKKNMLPLRQQKSKSVATVSFGARRPTLFQRQVKETVQTTDFVISRKAKAKEARKLWSKLQRYDVVIVALYGPGSSSPSNHLGYSKDAAALVSKLAHSNKAIITLFDNAYTLNQFKGIENSRGLLLAYQSHYHAQVAAAKLLFGGIPARGKLPVTVNEHFRYGDGISKDKPIIHSALNSL